MYINVPIMDVTKPVRRQPIIREKSKYRPFTVTKWVIFGRLGGGVENDEDRDFILNGLRNGFDIIDPDAYPAVVEYENHISARPGTPSYKEATAQVLKEIEMGHYKVVSDPP